MQSAFSDGPPGDSVAGGQCEIAEIRKFAKQSGYLSKADMFRVGKVVEVAKDVMGAGIKGCVTAAGMRLCSRSTSSDVTFIIVSHRVESELQHGCIMRRAGKACHEFQVGVSMYQRVDSDLPPRMSIRDPMPMANGKQRQQNGRSGRPAVFRFAKLVIWGHQSSTMHGIAQSTQRWQGSPRHGMLARSSRVAAV